MFPLLFICIGGLILSNLLNDEKIDIENQENSEQVYEKLYSEKEVKIIARKYALTSATACLFAFVILMTIQLVYVLNEYSKENYSSSVNKYLNILELYEKDYISDIDLDKAIDYSIAGIVQSVDDKYGAYIPAGNEVISSQIVSGNYYGLGVTLHFQDTFLEIVDIVEDSPAGRSDLKIGDCITKINNEPVTVEVYEKFRTEINKKEIKKVVLEINHEKEVTIKLGDVKEKKVNYFVENGVGYITISTFVMDTISEFKDAIDFVVENKVSEIVFDIRGNSGGDVEAVQAMLDYILEDCLLISMEYANGEKKEIYSDKNSAINKDLSIKILADNDSASASELFIMALQDNYGVELIGKTTYGKSTVLKYYTFRDGSFLSMSVGTYYSDSGRYIEGVGITPDIELSDEEIKLSIEELRKLEIIN